MKSFYLFTDIKYFPQKNEITQINDFWLNSGTHKWYPMIGFKNMSILFKRYKEKTEESDKLGKI